jgi:hypothetical protein
VVPEGDAEVVARSEVTSDGFGGVGTSMGGASILDDEGDDVCLMEII